MKEQANIDDSTRLNFSVVTEPMKLQFVEEIKNTPTLPFHRQINEAINLDEPLNLDGLNIPTGVNKNLFIFQQICPRPTTDSRFVATILMSLQQIIDEPQTRYIQRTTRL